MPNPKRAPVLQNRGMVRLAKHPRNHLVEEVIVAATENADFEPLDELMAVLSSPYDDQPSYARYAEAPRSEQVVHETFCGT